MDECRRRRSVTIPHSKSQRFKDSKIGPSEMVNMILPRGTAIGCSAWPEHGVAFRVKVSVGMHLRAEELEDGVIAAGAVGQIGSAQQKEVQVVQVRVPQARYAHQAYGSRPRLFIYMIHILYR